MKFIKIWIPIVLVVIVFLIIWISRPQNIYYHREMKAGNVFADNITNYYRQHGQLPIGTDMEVLEKLNPTRPYKFWWPLYEARGEQTFTLTFIGGRTPYNLQYNSAHNKWEKIHPAKDIDLNLIPRHLSGTTDVWKMVLTNHSSKSIRYGDSYMIEHKEKKKWVPVYFLSSDQDDSQLTILGPGESATDTLTFSVKTGGYPAGHYRINKLIHSDEQEIWVVTDFHIQ